MIELQWEEMKSATATYYKRAKVFGGWLVEACNTIMTHMADGRLEEGYEWQTSITFIPDPNHEWQA